MSLDASLLWTGLLVFAARVIDVSMGTLRVIAIVHGLTRTAFTLGLVEISLWLWVISTVVVQVREKPVLAVFYALGFSTGNALGIVIEKRLAIGHVILRAISVGHGQEMARQLRQAGFAVTTFVGQGHSGPVQELYVVARRRDMERIVAVIQSIEPNVFYSMERAARVSRLWRPGGLPLVPGHK